MPKRSPPDSLASWCSRWNVGHPDGPTAQRYLEDQLGVSSATISRIVRGLQMPRPDIALALQRLTGVTVDSMTRALAEVTPLNRLARLRAARKLIARGDALLAAASAEK